MEISDFTSLQKHTMKDDVTKMLRNCSWYVTAADQSWHIEWRHYIKHGALYVHLVHTRYIIQRSDGAIISYCIGRNGRTKCVCLWGGGREGGALGTSPQICFTENQKWTIFVNYKCTVFISEIYTSSIFVLRSVPLLSFKPLTFCSQK